MAGSKVILLVGPSCAGKSTLARAVQAAADEPWVAQSLDGLFAATPEGWGSGGEHGLDGFRYEWLDGQVEGGVPVRRVACGPVGRRLLAGFHRAVAAYAAAGVNVVVDDMLLDAEVLADWASALAATPTLMVKVMAPKAELLRREAARTLHPTPGLAAGHFELHRGLDADIEIDTSLASPAEAARRILDLANSPVRPAALASFLRV